jgi:choline dehydrogenase-like flavoprotein
MSVETTYDVIVIGAGVSGSFMAKTLAEAGQKVLILEAGSAFTRTTYPRKEIDANSRLYWGGGVELNTSSTLALLRPKVVGGGSIVNQALMDRFDDDALDSWRSQSGADFFSTKELASWYDKAESSISIETVSEEFRNGNARIFAEGFKKNGFTCAPLVRAQKDCRFAEGNDCIECLAGCRIDSKQSMPVTVLRKALKAGAHIVSDFEVKNLKHSDDLQTVSGVEKV